MDFVAVGAITASMMGMLNDRPFIKMHGLGNDFVVLDARHDRQDLTRILAGPPARAIADRRHGVGCDQLIIMAPPRSPDTDIFMGILNADGGEVGACGNATRCVAAMLMDEKGTDRAVIETLAGPLETTRAEGGHITVDMGPVHTNWEDIPLAEPMDTLNLGIQIGPLVDPVAVNVGNPHASFFVDDVAAVDLEAIGPEVEHHPLFPERTNVQIVQVLAADHIRVRVWERGVGITHASGSSATATAVAACRRGYTGRRVTVDLDDGSLLIHWRDDNHVTQTGPWSESFRGVLPANLLAGAP